MCHTVKYLDDEFLDPELEPGQITTSIARIVLLYRFAMKPRTGLGW